MCMYALPIWHLVVEGHFGPNLGKPEISIIRTTHHLRVVGLPQILGDEALPVKAIWWEDLVLLVLVVDVPADDLSVLDGFRSIKRASTSSRAVWIDND